MTKNKAKTTKKEKGKRVAAIGLSAALAITGIFAFLTATDTKENTFKFGNIDIQLYEAFDNNQDGTVILNDDSTFSKPDYEYKDENGEYIQTSNGEVYTSNVPEVQTEKIIPNQVLEKAPWIVNTGDNDAYIYMKVGIPVDTVSTESLGTDGYFHPDNNGEPHEVEMFTLLKSDKTPGVNEGWTLIPYSDSTDYEVGEKDGQTYHYYVYGYTEGDGEDGIVEPDQVTTDLFSYVKFVNYDNQVTVSGYTPEEFIRVTPTEVNGYYKMTGPVLNELSHAEKIVYTAPSGNIDLGLDVLTLATDVLGIHTINDADIYISEHAPMGDSLFFFFLNNVDTDAKVDDVITLLNTEDIVFDPDNSEDYIFHNLMANNIAKAKQIILTDNEETMYGITNAEIKSFINNDASFQALSLQEKKDVIKTFSTIFAIKYNKGTEVKEYTFEDLLAYTKERVEYYKTHSGYTYYSDRALYQEDIETELEKLGGPAAQMLQLVLATKSTSGAVYYIDAGIGTETLFYYTPVGYNASAKLQESEVRAFLDQLGLGFWYNVVSAAYANAPTLEPGSIYDTSNALTIGPGDLSMCGPQYITADRILANSLNLGYDISWSPAAIYYNDYSYYYETNFINDMEPGFYTSKENQNDSSFVFYTSSEQNLSGIADAYNIPINAYGVQVNNRNYSSEKIPTTVTTKHRTMYLFDLPESMRQAYINYEEEKLDYDVSKGYIDSYEINELPNDDTYALYTEGVSYGYRGTNVVNPITGIPVTEEQVVDYTDEQFENLMQLTVSSDDDMYFIPDSTLASMNWAIGEETVPRDVISVIPSFKDLFSPFFDTEEEMNEELSELLGFTLTAADDISLVYYGDITEGEVYCVFAAYVTGNHTWDLSSLGVYGSFEPGLTIFSPEFTGAGILEYDGPTEGLTQVEVPYKNYTDKWVKLPGTWGNISTKSEINEIIDIENNCWNTTPNNTPKEYYDETDVTFSADFVGGYNSYGSCEGYAHGVYIVNIVEGSVTTASGIVLDQPGLYINSMDGHCFAKRDTETSKTTYTYSSSTADQTGATTFETLANTWEYASDKRGW